MTRRWAVLLTGLWVWLWLGNAPLYAQGVARPVGWSFASHERGAPPDYERVLPDDRINTIYLKFRPAEWEAEIADMTVLYGPFGHYKEFDALLERFQEKLSELKIESPELAEISAVTGIKQEVLALALSDSDVAWKLFAPMSREELQALAEVLGLGPVELGPTFHLAEGDFGEGLDFVRNPIWVAVDVEFEGQLWPEVGFRFRGNSSLDATWMDGGQNLPFKLDFDEFEDENPELDNQRFFGFKQLSFSNNWQDYSWQREKIVTDLHRAAGVPASETAYYAVQADIGDGAGYREWGVYTALELPEDTLIVTQFNDGSGNVYKPDGHGASFAAGAFDEASFDKQTNRRSGYADIRALFAALHDDARLSEPAAWRAELERAFNVDVFLRWLAMNMLIRNSDCYGTAEHNYYLYADPATGQLTWISWDHNFTLYDWARQEMGFEIGEGEDEPDPYAEPYERPNLAISLGLDEVDDSWPLIRFLLDDPVYRVQYRQYVAAFAAELFNIERLAPIIEANHKLLAAHLRARGAEQELENLRFGKDELLTFIATRGEEVAEFLGN